MVCVIHCSANDLWLVRVGEVFDGQVLDIRKSGKRRRKVRIELDCPPISIAGSQQSVVVAMRTDASPADTDRRPQDSRCAARRVLSPGTKPQLEGIDHSAGYFVLHLKDIAHISFVGLRPYLVSTVGSDQPHTHADGIAGLAHAALEHISDSQVVAYIPELNRAALEEE